MTALTCGNPTVSNDPARCARCGLPVLVRGDGRMLDVEPTALGIHLPNGGTVTPLQAALAWHGKAPAVGHATHRCSAIEQGVLFDVPEPVRERRVA